MTNLQDKDLSIALQPIIELSYDQHKYINLVLPKLFELLEGRQTLYLLPGGSLDVLLAIHKQRPDVLNWLSVYVIEVNKDIHELYKGVKGDPNWVSKQEVRKVKTKSNILSINLLHRLLNKNNIHLEYEEGFDQYLYERLGQDDDLLFVNTTTREEQREFDSSVLLGLVFERLSMGLPSLLVGCNSINMSRALEGSSTGLEEFYVDRYVGKARNNGRLSIHSYT